MQLLSQHRDSRVGQHDGVLGVQTLPRCHSSLHKDQCKLIMYLGLAYMSTVEMSET